MSRTLTTYRTFQLKGDAPVFASTARFQTVLNMNPDTHDEPHAKRDIPFRDAPKFASSPVSDSSDQSDSPRPSPDSTPPPDAFIQALREEVNQQRPRSPYSRAHMRSLSAASAGSGPPVARTRSLPLYEPHPSLSPSHSPVRPSSPLRIPPAARGSPRRSFEELRPEFNDMHIIAEDSELEVPPRPPPMLDPSLHSSFSQTAHTIHRSNSGRRRPRSPLQNLNTAQVPPPSPLSYNTSLSNASTSSMYGISPSTTPPPQQHPSINQARFNESYPTSAPHVPLSAYSNPTSSVSSTPTSLRSRSPSISSLETIPDTPDAETEAARAMEEILKFRREREAEGEESEEDRRGGSTGMIGRSASVSVKGSGRTDAKRKRWSVSGAESQSDFKMETIYEDP